MIANYMMIDDVMLDRLSGLDNEALLDTVDELEETTDEIYCMDKLWDGLHFLLTGTSASTPLEGDELSEAIVGTEMFNEDDEDADFIAFIEADRLPDIIDAMKHVDIEKLAQNAMFNTFRKEEIYPDIWLDENRHSLEKELQSEFQNLLSFYEKAEEKKASILISIF